MIIINHQKMKKMKARYIFIALLCMVSTTMMAQKQLTILHTNDTHSTIEPLNVNLADTMLAGRGGFIRRIAMLKEERQKDPELLYFDSGDFSQGSPYYNLYKGDVEIGLMNQMGIDASTIGNHEFDFGLDNLARLCRMANFPILCSNYDFTGTVMEGLSKPYIVLKRKGVKIGVFALDPMMDGLVSAKNCEGVKYLDPIETCKKMVRILRHEKKCDLVILVSHMGWEIDTVSDGDIIQATDGVDLVLGGHSHTYLKELQYVNNAQGKPVGVDQNGKHAIFVGKMILQLDKR